MAHINVILNIIIIFIFGAFVDKYITVGWTIGSKLWEKKVSQVIFLGVVFQVILGLVIVFMEYLTSYINGGNFLVASIISSIYEGVGGSFHASPLFNMISTILFSWIAFLLFPIGIRFIKGFEINKEFKSLEIHLGENKISIPIEIFRSVILFSSLMSTVIQLAIFYYIIYPHDLPNWVWAAFIFALLLTILASVVFIIDMQKVFKSIGIQALFIDEKKYQEVLELIEEIIDKGKTFILGQDISLEIMEYISFGIIVITPGVKQDSIILEKRYRLEMSEETKKIYKTEREVHRK